MTKKIDLFIGKWYYSKKCVFCKNLELVRVLENSIDKEKIYFFYRTLIKKTDCYSTACFYFNFVLSLF